MIRDADFGDVPTLVDLVLAGLTESPVYNEKAFSRARTSDLIQSLITIPDGIIVVSCVNDEIYGVIAGAVSEHLFLKELYAYEFGLFVQPKFRGGLNARNLILAFERQARARGAKEFRPGIMTKVNEDRTSRLYEQLGYTVTGSTLVKRF